ncbi:hypothetical protein LB515_02345 [Mesorhizobium sp. CA15]|nr:hypothetical protein [Mesorhizobium sp. CA15]
MRARISERDFDDFRRRKGRVHSNKGVHVVQQTQSKKAEIDAAENALSDRLIDEKALAVRWGVSTRTLQNKRVAGNGIPFLKISSSVRYRMSDVIAFENAAMRLSTSDFSDAN